jgi:chemotaxis response regulator CheB
MGCTVKRIRVLVANRPRLMRDLVLATISEQPDIEIVGEIQDDAQIMPVVEETQPDFVIVALDKPEERPHVCDLVLERHPNIRILALAPEHNISMFYWASLAIHSNRVEASEEGVLDALRGSGQTTGGLP